jgi:general transcription factor 3C polypeptide 5 (transcription factor C subunit 1)
MDSLSFAVPQQECIAIEYPGFVRNVDKALRTLGGVEAISAAATQPGGAFLKLHFRPEEPTSHAIYGERTTAQRLLLRISRPRGTAGEDGSSSGATAPVTARVVARVPTSIRFNGLADYQYIPVDPTLRSRPSMPYDQRPEKAEPSRIQQPFLLIPPLFSKVDVPQVCGPGHARVWSIACSRSDACA